VVTEIKEQMILNNRKSMVISSHKQPRTTRTKLSQVVPKKSLFGRCSKN